MSQQTENSREALIAQALAPLRNWIHTGAATQEPAEEIKTAPRRPATRRMPGL